MSEEWFCPKDSVEHKTFECYVRIQATWLVNEKDEYINERNSEVCDMDDYECHECGAKAVWGVPPSALELLAEAAE